MKFVNGLSVVAFVLICVYLSKLVEPKVCINSNVVQNLITPTGEEILSCGAYWQNPFLYKNTLEKQALEKTINSLQELDVFFQYFYKIKNPISILISGSDTHQVSGQGTVVVPSHFLGQSDALNELVLLEWIEQMQSSASKWQKSLYAKLLLESNQLKVTKQQLHSPTGYCQQKQNKVSAYQICQQDVNSIYRWSLMDIYAESISYFLRHSGWNKKQNFLNQFLEQSLISVLVFNDNMDVESWKQQFKNSLAQILNFQIDDEIYSRLIEEIGVFNSGTPFKMIVAPDFKNKLITNSNAVIIDKERQKFGLSGLSFLRDKKQSIENLVYLKCKEISVDDALKFRSVKNLIVIDSCEEEIKINLDVKNINEFAKLNNTIKFKVIDVKSLNQAQAVMPLEKGTLLNLEQLRNWLKWKSTKYSVITTSFTPLGTLDVVRIFRN